MSAKPKPQFAKQFSFESWNFELETGQLKFHYHDSKYGNFTETYIFADVDTRRFQKYESVIGSAINCLFWMSGVSYYKTSLAKSIVFNDLNPNKDLAKWLTQTWQAGLAELAFENNLGWLGHIDIHGESAGLSAEKINLKPRSLVAIGGGKDSLVTIEAIKAMPEPASLFVVGQSKFIKSVAEKTGLPLLQIQRKVDPKLIHINEKGAYNGHVPITAINTCVAVVAALLYDYDSVVFSNERSADSGNVQLDSGQWVNHQYSKSLIYEQTWQQIIEQYIAQDLSCFSLLRPFSELAIVKKFAALSVYFPHFSSCNRNFHLTGSQNSKHHWCGKCPKCAFVFLCLAPFVNRKELLAIFNQDLLADVGMKTLFESLLGIEGMKPFECVGEQQECRLALQLLGQQAQWQNHHQIKQWLSVLPEIKPAQIDHIMSASEDHMIPHKRSFIRAIINAS